MSDNNSGTNISGNQGDVYGVNVSGSGNVIGKNIVVGSGTINVDESKVQHASNEYVEAVKKFSDDINEQLKGREITEDKVKSINNNLTQLAKEVEDVKPGEEDKVKYAKKSNVEAKTASIVEKILDVLPEAAENIALFTPLAPISKIIGKTIKSIVDAVRS